MSEQLEVKLGQSADNAADELKLIIDPIIAGLDGDANPRKEKRWWIRNCWLITLAIFVALVSMRWMIWPGLFKATTSMHISNIRLSMSNYDPQLLMKMVFAVFSAIVSMFWIACHYSVRMDKIALDEYKRRSEFAKHLIDKAIECATQRQGVNKESRPRICIFVFKREGSTANKGGPDKKEVSPKDNVDGVKGKSEKPKQQGEHSPKPNPCSPSDVEMSTEAPETEESAKSERGWGDTTTRPASADN